MADRIKTSRRWTVDYAERDNLAAVLEAIDDQGAAVQYVIPIPGRRFCVVAVKVHSHVEAEPEPPAPPKRPTKKKRA